MKRGSSELSQWPKSANLDLPLAVQKPRNFSRYTKAMQPAIRVENLSKKYRLGAHQGDGYRTLRQSLTNGAAYPVRALRRILGKQSSLDPQPPTDFWALKDVSFEVQPGEVVGIIGRNGAGKSTLLKIVSRITEPTNGRITYRGRVGSLLEVGTGFHSELTGRENIFLNGGILGMTRREIHRQFDEIVAFAEIDQFLDTPVKRYSSGMYIRLAFAVAAHLEPEIMIVDEVLAVGDLEFQRKCLAKMKDVGRDGRTILFVSHNLSALQALCGRGVVLSEGKLEADGPIHQSVAHYLRAMEAAATTDLSKRTDRLGGGPARLTRIDISGENQCTSGHVAMGSPIRFTFHLSMLVPEPTCIFTILDHNGGALARFNSNLRGPDDGTNARKKSAMVCSLQEMLLAPGRYRIDVAFWAHGELLDWVESACFFDVVSGLIRGRESPRKEGGWKVFLPHCWQ